MNNPVPNSFRTGPDEGGRFGNFGGRFVSETLMLLILQLEAEYEKAKTDSSFWAEMEALFNTAFALRFYERLGFEPSHWGMKRVL